MPWQIAATVPAPVTAYGDVAVFGGWLYLFGGDTGVAGVFQNNVVIYPTGNVWAWPIAADGSLGTPTLSLLPEPYENVTLAVTSNGYAFSSGFTYGDLNADGGTAFGLTRINVCRLIGGRVIAVPQLTANMPDGFPSYLDAAPVMHVIGNYLYVHSIMAPGLSTRPENVKVGYLARINADGTLGTWGSFPAFPTPSVPGISFGAHAVFGSGMYWAGGQRDDDNTLATAIYYVAVDPLTGLPSPTWTKVGDMSLARYRFGGAVAVVNGQPVLALVGGHDFVSTPLALAETSALNQDGTLQGLGLIDPLPLPSRNLALAASGNHIYALGGHNGLNGNLILPYIYRTDLGSNGKQS